MLKWYQILHQQFMDKATEGGEGGGAGTGTVTPPAKPPGLTQQQLEQFAGPLMERITQSVDASLDSKLAPVREAQAKLEGRIDELSKPITQGGRMFGAPGVRTGEDPLTSRGWSMQRLMGLRTGYYREQDCRPEMEIHNRLWKVYVEQGNMQLESRQSYLVPLGSICLQGFDDKEREEVRQMLYAGVDGADVDRMVWTMQSLLGNSSFNRKQALSIFDDAGMGTFLGATMKGEMIPLLRNREVFSRAGATNLTLGPNGRLQFDKHTGSVTAYWVGEVPSNKSSPTITASEPTTGYLTLLAKKLAVLVKLPNELIRFGSPETELFLRDDMIRTAAIKADLTMLEGVGTTNTPKGLITYAGITPHTASTAATDGNTFEPEDVNLMKVALEELNHDPEEDSASWIMRPKMFGNLTNRRAVAHTAGTYDGPWLFPTNRSDMANGVAPRLSGLPVVKSTQVSNTRIKNSGTDLTYVLLGIFRHWIIGRIGVAEIAKTDVGDTAFTTDQTWMRFIQHMDAGPRYENAFCLCDQIDMDLPAIP